MIGSKFTRRALPALMSGWTNFMNFCAGVSHSFKSLDIWFLSKEVIRISGWLLPNFYVGEKGNCRSVRKRSKPPVESTSTALESITHCLRRYWPKGVISVGGHQAPLLNGTACGNQIVKVLNAKGVYS